MSDLSLTADQLVTAALELSATEPVCILDSCGVGYLGSHQLIVGIDPVDVSEVSNEDPAIVLESIDEKLGSGLASIFTLSYDLGAKLIGQTDQIRSPDPEPDVSIATFDTLIIHDYDTGETRLVGSADKFPAISTKLTDALPVSEFQISDLRSEITDPKTVVTSNLKKGQYLAAVEEIKERIRSGDTYQTNLTQQFTAILPDGLSPQFVFHRLRRDHPAPFAAFITRKDSTVVSASPERFFKISGRSNARDTQGGNPTGREGAPRRTISTSPIKGTRPRGATKEEDIAQKLDLLSSQKDRAENTMIVDLLRNDLGRVCEYGSVRVESLCELEEHPTFFHLVSTVSGELRNDASFSDILKAVFPCGSITGAPKISTMKIIDELEPTKRGLSMGAIGYHLPAAWSKVQRPKSNDLNLDLGHWTLDAQLDLSVAIRTMVIRGNQARFNVGGGIVIDSDPESEYQETLTKAKALFSALGVN